MTEHRQPREGYTPRHAFVAVWPNQVRDFCWRQVDEYDGWPVYCGFTRLEHYVRDAAGVVPAWQEWADR